MIKRELVLKPITAAPAIVALAAMNLFDLIFTLIGIFNGYITEGNPIMRSLFIITPAGFIFLKVILSLLTLVVMGYGYMKFKWVRYAVYVPLAAYFYVFVLHAGWIYLVISGKIA